MAPGYRVLAAATIAAVSLLACGDEPAETSTPTTTLSQAASPSATATATTQPTPSPTPVTLENAAGPLLYYVAGAPHEAELRAVDLATGVEVLRQQLGRFSEATMRGERLLVRTEGSGRSALVELALDGSTVRTLHEGPFGIPDFEISPDGTKIVLVEHRTRALVLDWQSLDVIAELGQDELPSAIGDGVLSWAQWVDDSQHVILDIGVERDGCGPGHVILRLDGTFDFIEEDGCNHTAPNGRLMADPGGTGCFIIGGENVRVLDALSGREISTYAEGGTMLTPWSWAPDSSEVLVRRMHVPEGADPESCTYTSSLDEIIERIDWITIQPSTGTATSIEDFDALFDRWFPDHRVTLSCGTPLPQVLWSRFGHQQVRCPSDAGMGTVSVDGVAVGEATEIEVLGFVER